MGQIDLLAQFGVRVEQILTSLKKRRLGELHLPTVEQRQQAVDHVQKLAF